jgi:SAM-dependent methyltransferase
LNYQRIYEYRFAGVDQCAREAVWSVIARYIQKLMGNPEIILDPAGGRGEFLRSLPEVRERWMVDAVKTIDDAFLKGIHFIELDIRSVDLPSCYFDGIFVSNFLEHLDSQADIYNLLAKFKTSLKPGGVIAIMGPNFKYCAQNYFDCADHRTPLTHVSMEELLYSAGFSIERSIPRFLPFSFRSILPANKLFTRLYLAFPWLWQLAGRQFLLLARKSFHETNSADTK